MAIFLLRERERYGSIVSAEDGVCGWWAVRYCIVACGGCVAAKVVNVVCGVAELLPRCERLMLASRRAKKRVSALDCKRLRSDVATCQQLVSI